MQHRASIFPAHNQFQKIEAIPYFTMPSPTDLGPLGPAPPVGQYASTDDIKGALQAHARDNGYAISVDSKTPERAGWICSKGGKYNDKNKSHDVHPTKRRRNTGTTKTGCPFRVRATYNKIDAIWTSVIVNPDHNHDAAVSISALLHHRLGAITDAERENVAKMSQLGHSPTAILTALRHANPNLCLVPRDIYNLLYGLRLDELASSTPVEWLLMVQ
jgi:hypothetical protein